MKFLRWQNGLTILVLSLPLVGAIALWLYPAVWPRALKDIIIIIPLYLSALLSGAFKKGFQQMKQSLRLAISLWVLVIFVECFNPHVESWKMVLIGLKTWLFYLPLLPLAMLWGHTDDERRRILRLIVWPSVIPAVFGVIQWYFDHQIGYERTMESIYGAAAYGACQRFASFTLGTQHIFRVPSTFTYAAQFYCYLLAVIPMAYALMQREETPLYRRRATQIFWLTIFASFISGVRAAYVFTPLIVITVYVLDRQLLAGFKALVIASVLLLLSLQLPFLFTHHFHFTHFPEKSIPTVSPPPIPAPPVVKSQRPPAVKVVSKPIPPLPPLTRVTAPTPVTAPIPIHVRATWLDMGQWRRMMGSLLKSNGSELVVGSLIEALHRAPMGMGTGTNTGASRYVVKDLENFAVPENYYAKTVMEIGVLGLMALLGLFGILLASGIRCLRSDISRPNHSLAAALLGYLVIAMIYNSKGFPLDLDPMNVLFWIYGGLLLGLYPHHSHEKPLK